MTMALLVGTSGGYVQGDLGLGVTHKPAIMCLAGDTRTKDWHSTYAYPCQTLTKAVVEVIHLGTTFALHPAGRD